MLEAIRQLWESAPDLRLGQIISVLDDAVQRRKMDPFNIEDDIWLDVIHEQGKIATIKGREDFKYKKSPAQ